MDNITSISDNRIMALYRLTRQEYAAAVTTGQKQAIEQLKITLCRWKPGCNFSPEPFETHAGNPPVFKRCPRDLKGFFFSPPCFVRIARGR